MGMFALSAMTMLVSCGEDSQPMGKGAGRISPAVDLDGSITKARSSEARDVDVSVNDLQLTLTSSDGVAKTWSYGDFPSDQDFRVGDYTLEAVYGNVEDEGFDKPAYYGATTLKVKENETTRPTLTATLANALISVEYTESFKDYMTDWSASLHSLESTSSVTIAQDETRPAYMRPGTVALAVNFTMPNGQQVEGLKVADIPAEARHHYTMTVNVNNGDTGTAQLVISFDDSIEGTEDVVINLDEDLVNAPAPVVTTEGFVSGEAIPFVAGMIPDNSLTMKIVARGGLKSVRMTTSSVSLVEKGWPAEIDLLTATAAQQSVLASLGFSAVGLFRNPDQMAVIDMTKIFGGISKVDTGDNTTTVSIVVEDKFSKVSEPVALVIKVEDLILNLSPVTTTYSEAGEPVEFALEYNGIDPDKNVKLQYRNKRSTWTDMEVTSVREASSRAASSYIITAKAPDTGETLNVRAVCGSTESESTVSVRMFPKLNVQANDVFARYAMLTASGKIAEGTVFEADGGAGYQAVAATAEGGKYRLSGLAPGTAYSVRLSYNGEYSDPVAFTTEAAAQLDDAGLETWTTSDSGSHWECYVPGSWGTNNPMTTSQGNNYAYKRISGTKPTTDAHSGSSAAQIRTNGWGSSNTAGGGASIIKYVDAGLLHLGASRTVRPSGYGDVSGTVSTDDLDCGIAFASRPSALKFWYKYAAHDSDDAGLALVWVKDAAGNVLATGQVSLTSQDTYTEVSVPLTYAAGAAKAGKIYVKFLSTQYENKLVKGSLSLPPFAGNAQTESSGSTLFIDDVTFEY